MALSNLHKRAITIVLAAPTLLWLLASSKVYAAVVVFIAVLVGGIEWSGIKRHLKVSLLLQPNDLEGSEKTRSSPGSVADAADSNNPSRPARRTQSGALFPALKSSTINGVPLHPEEYALPVVSIKFYQVIKHLGWACLVLAAYHSEHLFSVLSATYFIVFVVVTLTAHNQLESTVQDAIDSLCDRVDVLQQLADQVTQARDDVVKAQREYFLALELHIIAEKQPTEQFLDFCLDIFGYIWISGIITPLCCYSIPRVGVAWIICTMMGNFANDIMALLVGRTCAQQRDKLRRIYDCQGGSSNGELGAGAKRPLSEAGVLHRFLLSGPHPLYSAISPNKSKEGAIAGVLANALVFAGTMQFSYAFLVAAPSEDIIHPYFQSFVVWFALGAVMGVLGVIGDLLQSLLKRTAHVKDAGFIIPGHGGMLDRVDGLLLVFPFMYCTIKTIMLLTSAVAEQRLMP